MRGDVSPFRGEAGGFGGHTATYTGGWPATAPGPTSGSSMVLPAGVLRAICNATAYAPVSSVIAVDVYLDGVYKGVMKLNPQTAVNEHASLSTLTFQQTVTAGTHYVYFRQISGASDFNDIGSFFGIVTPT